MSGVLRFVAAVVTLLAAASICPAEPRAASRPEPAPGKPDIKLTLVEAIQAAQKHLENARIVHIRLDPDSKPPVYRAELLTREDDLELTINAMTGDVRREQEDTHEADDEREQEEEDTDGRWLAGAARAVQLATISMSQAVEAALQKIHTAQAISAAVGLERRKPVYQVELREGDKPMLASVDALSGKVLNVTRRYPTEQTWHFDAIADGGLPREWTIRQTGGGSLAQWQVTRDPSAPSPPNVLSLISTRNTGSIYNLAVADDSSFKDLDASVVVRADAGKEDQGGGLIWRCKDEKNYYICRVNPLENNYRLYKVVNGKREQLGSASVIAPTGEWHTLRVIMIGNDITCYLNGAKLLHTRDATFRDAGHVGLWTKADAVTSFDDLNVSTPGRRPIRHREREDDDDSGREREAEHERGGRR